MVEVGEQALWDLGVALVLVERPLPGLRASLSLVHRDWDGQEREERHELRQTAEGWTATPPVEGRAAAPTLAELLPLFCVQVPPTQIGPIGGPAATPF